MSCDRIYTCQGTTWNSWVESYEAEREGRAAEFWARKNDLYQKGNFVVLSARANCLIDELYLFDDPEHAREFFASGFILRERSGEVLVGFQEISLYLRGRLIAGKTLSPTEVYDDSFFLGDDGGYTAAKFPTEDLTPTVAVNGECSGDDGQG